MFELIITIMLQDHSVKEVNLHTAAPSMNACMMDQHSMAEYIASHNVMITKWRCVEQGQEANL